MQNLRAPTRITSPYIKGCALVTLAFFVLTLLLPVGALISLIFWPEAASYSFVLALVIAVVGYTFFTLSLVLLFVQTRAISARVLDAEVAPLGLVGGSYLIGGRHYHGIYQGRDVDIFYHRLPMVYRRSFRRMTISVVHTFTIHMTGSPGTYLSITQPPPPRERRVDPPRVPESRYVYDLPGHDIDIPGLEHLHVYALDKAWLDVLLTRPEAKASLRDLLGEPPTGQGFIHMDPESLVLEMLYYQSADLAGPRQINTATIEQHLEALSTLAHVAEAASPSPESRPHPIPQRSVKSHTLLKVVGTNLIPLLFIISVLLMWMCLCIAGVGAMLAVQLQ